MSDKCIPYVDLQDIISDNKEKKSYQLLGMENGCVAGCCCGITIYDKTEYGKGGVHDDQEGFFVLEGQGMAKIGEQEFPIYPGIAFFAPAGVHHTIKKDSESEAVKVFWFHSAV